MTDRRERPEGIVNSGGRCDSKVGPKTLSEDLCAYLDDEPNRIIVVSKNFRVRWANRAATLSVPGSKTIGRFCYDVLFQRRKICERCPARESFQSGESATEMIRTADDRTLELRTSILGQDDEAYVIETARDLSPWAIKEPWLSHSRRFETIGRMTSTIAHDFNNLLTGICGNTSLALMMVDESGPLLESLLEVEKAADRASQLTSQLLAYCRRPTVEAKIADTSTVLEGMQAMLRRLVGDEIRLHLELERELPLVRMAPAKLEQILLNLIVNSRDAMPAGGEITVRTNVVIADEHLRQHYPKAKRPQYVRISVVDTGLGIEEEHLKRVFEPYFTTKEGDGSGLGLTFVDTIVRESTGFVSVFSQKGEGSRFEVLLPTVEKEQQSYHPLLETESRSRCIGTVLVVEDESSVRRLAATILGRIGYHVLAVNTGERALELVAQRSEPIDLLITDIVMPGMNGTELAQRLLEVSPQMKVISMSGYTETQLQSYGVDVTTIHFLRKPFKAGALTQMVNDILGVVPES